LLVAVSAAIAAFAVAIGTVRDLGSFRGSILTGSSGGAYYSLASNLAQLAKGDHGHLEVVATAGSIENVSRLIADRGRCVEKFAFIQDGTPVSPDSGLELLGRLPDPESLLFLARRGRGVASFSDLQGSSVGIGPDGSGTAHLVLQLLGDPDLSKLGIRISYHALEDQARLVAQGSLDFAAFVMRNDADFLRTIISQYDLEIVELQDLQGLVGRYPWLSLGRVPAGRYDLVRKIPPTDKVVPQVNTLVLASPCAKRADRVELLVLLAAELPTFVRSNPPSSTSSETQTPLSPEARQFFLTGEPEFVDRYFPWLVNLMSPAYWIYLAMAVTALFNALKGFSHFRLWRLDAAREKLEAEAALITGEAITHAHVLPSKPVLLDVEARVAIQDILNHLARLRLRCRRYANSFATPMGDEMFYRYQQSLIDHTATTLRTMLNSGERRAPASLA
jgi:TRAP-type uncharacterized transport system substrate-binding protein